MSTKVKQKQTKLFQIICFCLFLIGFFISELFWREPLHKISIDFIEKFQNLVDKDVLKVLKYFRLIQFYPLLIFIIIIVYNFSNSYKTFVLITVLHFSWGISSILKMIYEGPRPYFESSSIEAFGCEAGWGNPSDYGIVATSFYLTLWKVLIDNSRINKCIKYSLLTLCITTIFILFFSTIITGIHSFNQIIFGFIIGVLLYVLAFSIFDINVHDYTQFLKILNKYSFWIVINYFVIFILGILLYNLRKYSEQDRWIERINVKCSDRPINLRFHDEALIELFYFFSSMPAIFSLKSELIFSFNANKKIWKEFNFDVSNLIDETGLLESTRMSINLNIKTQWNHTTAVISIVRIILSFFLTGIIFLPNILIRYDNNLLIVLFLKVLLPLLLFYYSLFYIFKGVFKIFKVSNFSLSVLNDSTNVYNTKFHQRISLK